MPIYFGKGSKETWLESVILMNVGLAIIGFLAFVQFLWMPVANEKNAFITNLGSSFRFWYDKAIAFLLGASEDKPFPWQKV